MRSTERPSAAQSNVEPKPPSTSFNNREMQGIYELIRQIRKVMETMLWIVQRLRIHRLYFNAANASFLHCAQFPLQLWFRDRRTKPPPAHQNSAIVRRISEAPPQGLQFSHGGGRLGSRMSKENHKHRE